MEAEVLALVTDFVAAHEVERAAVVAELAEGERDAGGAVFGGGLAADLMVQGGGFVGPGAPKTPAGGRHRLDEGFFKRGLRLEFIEEFGDEIEEAVLELDVEGEGIGEESVTSGITGRDAFAAGRDRSAGFGAVFGSHGQGCSTREEPVREIEGILLILREIEIGSGGERDLIGVHLRSSAAREISRIFEGADTNK